MFVPGVTTEKTGPMTLFFGCRTRLLDLYMEEKEAMRRAGVLTHTYLALSREPKLPKVMWSFVMAGVCSFSPYFPNFFFHLLLPFFTSIHVNTSCHDIYIRHQTRNLSDRGSVHLPSTGIKYIQAYLTINLLSARHMYKTCWWRWESKCTGKWCWSGDTSMCVGTALWLSVSIRN